MSPRNSQLPSAASVRAVLDALDLDNRTFSIHSLPSTFSNFTHLVNVELEDGSTRRIVLRRYNSEKTDAGHNKHRCEYQALKLLRKQGIPVPPPLLLDETGELLGLPGIVTEYIEGTPIELPADAARWGEMAAKAGRMLARIHHTPFSDADKRFLMDDDIEVAWFVKDGLIPDYMRADPDGLLVWHLVNDHWGRWAPVEPRFAHTDYWSGNILWRGDEISAVVDWEEAGYGHPAADVAYCRMGYFIEGIPEAAETFLRAYEAAAGWTLTDLPLFELAASARPMTDPTDWFAYPYMEAGFRRFIARAREKLTAAGG
ncbi:MAG: aminoglycoside phosphotransferase family protein [Chloroflexota bacterium]|nr:aminoglycoside phosphotransferase family protein [Chloroflexota bacterium]